MDSSVALALIAAGLGLAAGILLAWLLLRGRIEAAREQGRSEGAADRAVLAERAAHSAALEQRIAAMAAQQEADQVEIRRLATAEARSVQALEAERDALERAREDLRAARAAHEAAVREAGDLRSRVADLGRGLESERSRGAEKLEVLQKARDELANQFKALANEILEEKSKRFTEQNQANLGQLLEPLRIRLQEFQGKVEEVYVQEGKDRSALADQVRRLMELNQALSQDAKNLTQALKGSGKTQGDWGELILERVLEESGLRRGEEYDVQESHTRDDGSRPRPDVVVHLPGSRELVVDAKVSLTAYEEFASAEEETERVAALKRHLDSVRTHIRGLAEKNYHELYGLKSLDFVLMFIPIEPAFMLAVSRDRTLFMDAWQKNVLLVSPSTLLFVVRTVAHLWRQEAQSRNAQEIARRGAELYDRLVGFVADLDKVGERLQQAQDSFHLARDKLGRNKGNVIRQAEMLKDLGVKPSRALPEAWVEQADGDAGLAPVRPAGESAAPARGS